MISLLEKYRETEEDSGLSDESILNVLRRKDDKVHKTAEIADELPISQNWTSQRLNELEDQGRVHSKSAGAGRVWWLDEAETSYPVAEGVGDLMWYSSLAKEASRTAIISGIGMFVIGGFALILLLILDLSSAIDGLPITLNDLATIALLCAMLGGLFIILWAVLKSVSLAIQRHFSIE